ncbi:radical SAM family heme chaperone HemW [Xylanimonas ulmi]|uniref:Heme chaperone HemW n=1 Tax=Xylanimonas ulmi TaxID=228973 RepID=A0A4V2EXQ0_9MICO|nr:radical SAM family heme chaperone HemW [Xylanibacterium ulmi]RZS60260.1 anaerobic coproporphyrinogen III oxidase [Xylanibacterium ulmi]
MPQLPEGVPLPDDGALPPWVADRPTAPSPLRGRFGVYVHVPFCSVRCGYCDFNTYTATELGGGASQHSYASTALREVALARRVLDASGVTPRPVSTVFFGGGTPTMLPASDLVRILHGVRDAWGLAEASGDGEGAEVTTEANPDSVTPASLRELADGGFTRVSFGMQSAVPSVLATLDRTHDPRRIPDVVAWARDAGLEVSLDLIYGTPGETLDDWRASLEAVLATGVEHVSAYALVVEPGTKMGAQVRRGLLPLPDEDDQATKYELADELLGEAGLEWYEVSNWSKPGHECRHNLAYWRGDDWWGVGPGAHSYVAAPRRSGDARGVSTGSTGGMGATGGMGVTGEPAYAGVRWWNVKHPRRYAALLEQGRTPGAARELLTAQDDALERVMLGIRLREGLPLDALTRTGRAAVAAMVARGLLDGPAALGADGGVRRALLTLRGRLLADAVVRDLTD